MIRNSPRSYAAMVYSNRAEVPTVSVDVCEVLCEEDQLWFSNEHNH